MACLFFKTFLVYVVTEKYMHGQPEVFWRLTEHRQRSPVVVRRLRRPRWSVCPSSSRLYFSLMYSIVSTTTPNKRT